MPCQTYNQFVNQINKAIRFYRRLVCRECGHILFPTQTRSHSKFKCLVPTCTEYNKEIYLNYCYNCKPGLIDSRDTKQCPNDLYICPSCDSCCSNALFEAQAAKYRIIGRPIPVRLSRVMGNGHYDRDMHFCYKCGAQKMMYYDQSGNKKWKCPHCDTTKNEASSKEGIS